VTGVEQIVQRLDELEKKFAAADRERVAAARERDEYRALYLETMERVLGPMDKTIVDSNSSSAPVPYIALDPLQSRTGGSGK